MWDQHKHPRPSWESGLVLLFQQAKPIPFWSFLLSPSTHCYHCLAILERLTALLTGSRHSLWLPLSSYLSHLFLYQDPYVSFSSFLRMMNIGSYCYLHFHSWLSTPMNTAEHPPGATHNSPEWAERRESYGSLQLFWPVTALPDLGISSCLPYSSIFEWWATSKSLKPATTGQGIPCFTLQHGPFSKDSHTGEGRLKIIT